MIRYLLALILAASTFAAPVTVRVPMPTAYTNGAALPATARVGASVYCGPTAGQYVQAWGVVGTADMLDVTIDVRSRVFCAATVVAAAADGTGQVESDFSVEFTLTPNQPQVPVNITTVRQTPAICTTTCAVTRTR